MRMVGPLEKSGGLLGFRRLDALPYAVLVRGLLDFTQQAAQCSVVHYHRGGLQVVHLHHLAQERVEESHQAQCHRAGDHRLRLVPGHREGLFDDFARRDRSRSRQMPDPAIGCRILDQPRHYGSYVGHEDVLMRRVERSNHLRSSTSSRGDKNRMEKALIHARAVKVRQPQYRAVNLAGGVGFEQQVFLLLAHASLEGVRIARMIFPDRMSLRKSVGIHRADQQNALYAGCDRAVQRLAHELRMQLEVIVGDADEINESFDVLRCRAYRRRIVRVPGNYFGKRVGAEGFLQTRLRAAYDSILLVVACEAAGNALPDCPCRAEQCDLLHCSNLTLPGYWSDIGFCAIRSAKRGSVRRLANTESV